MTSKAKKPAKAKPAAAKRAGGATATTAKVKATKAPAGKNPLLEPWTTPFEMPPFDKVKTEHFLPAIDTGFAENLEEIAAIASIREAPTFANTIDALERAGAAARSRVGRVLQPVGHGYHAGDPGDRARGVAALCQARHGHLSERQLFARVDALMKERKKLGLTLEQTRVLERYHRGFVKAGAKLDEKAKARLAKIAERSATLGTQFGQNVLKDEQGWLLVLESEADLAGLPDAVRAAAAQTANDRGKRASTRLRCRAPASSRSCSFRRGAICARRPSRPGSRAAPTAARRTTAPSSPRCWGCGRSTRSCSASRTRPTRRSTTRWPRRRTRCASC